MSREQKLNSANDRRPDLPLAMFLIISMILWLIPIVILLDFRVDIFYSQLYRLPITILIVNIIYIILIVVLFFGNIFLSKTKKDKEMKSRLKELKIPKISTFLVLITIILYLIGEIVHSFSNFFIIVIDMVCFFIPIIWLIVGSYCGFKDELAPQFAYKGLYIRSRNYIRKISSRNTKPSAYLILMPIIVIIISVFGFYFSITGKIAENINLPVSIIGSIFYIFGGIPSIGGGILLNRYNKKFENKEEKKKNKGVNRFFIIFFLYSLVYLPLLCETGMILSTYICNYLIQTKNIWIGFIQFLILLVSLFLLGLINIPSMKLPRLKKNLILLIDSFLLFLAFWSLLPSLYAFNIIINPNFNPFSPTFETFMIIFIMVFAGYIACVIGYHYNKKFKINEPRGSYNKYDYNLNGVNASKFVNPEDNEESRRKLSKFLDNLINEKKNSSQ